MVVYYISQLTFPPGFPSPDFHYLSNLPTYLPTDLASFNIIQEEAVDTPFLPYF